MDYIKKKQFYFNGSVKINSDLQAFHSAFPEFSLIVWGNAKLRRLDVELFQKFNISCLEKKKINW